MLYLWDVSVNQYDRVMKIVMKRGELSAYDDDDVMELRQWNQDHVRLKKLFSVSCKQNLDLSL